MTVGGQDRPVLVVSAEEAARVVTERGPCVLLPVEVAGSLGLPARLVDADELAAYLRVARSWVYEHADELGARRLGNGPRARLRFSIAEAEERMASCVEGRRPEEAESRTVERKPGTRRRRRSGTGGELLPIRARGGVS